MNRIFERKNYQRTDREIQSETNKTVKNLPTCKCLIFIISRHRVTKLAENKLKAMFRRQLTYRT
jgi:hypothetical protein